MTKVGLLFQDFAKAKKFATCLELSEIKYTLSFTNDSEPMLRFIIESESNEDFAYIRKIRKYCDS